MGTALVIENDPTDDVRRLGEWLVEGGLELRVLRPHAGDDLPDDLDGYVALVVLGGPQPPYPLPDGTPGAPWFPKLEGLLRKAVRHRVPTLGICLGGQLLATAHAGLVERSPSGPEVGPAVVGKRDAAETDPLFKYVPLIPDVFQWHVDEITELPHGATLLAASTRYPNQAFRLGDRAWGFQFHIECDTAMIADWATDSALLADLGYDPELVVAACDRLMADVEEVWQPFAIRFAALALGELGDDTVRRDLPLLGH
ncbi:type 1 glutamine amidotransferase [Micromonospora okii]|uniref:type 1 glutamine amidotransferase n=1 Tax=Micromonospora okii TaxID=1182970 RepID=UPI001E54BCCC|nr:type 1 glutamine amidotransferase [Micromonospora okii]